MDGSAFASKGKVQLTACGTAALQPSPQVPGSCSHPQAGCSSGVPEPLPCRSAALPAALTWVLPETRARQSHHGLTVLRAGTPVSCTWHRWTLESEPFPCSWEVRSSHQGSTACHTEEEAQTWNSTGVHSLEQEHALRVYWQLIPKVFLSHRAKAWSWCRLTGWQRDMVEMSEWGRNRESCSLKEDADSTNAEHLPGTAGGVFQEPAGHPCWGVSPFTNQTQKGVHREPFCDWSLCALQIAADSDLCKPSSEILLSSPISQALKTKGAIYRCGYSQFCLDPFLATPSSLQVCASCQWHLCKTLPRARIKDHTWSALTLSRDPTAHKTQLFWQIYPSVLLQGKSVFLRLLDILRT